MGGTQTIVVRPLKNISFYVCLPLFTLVYLQNNNTLLLYILCISYMAFKKRYALIGKIIRIHTFWIPSRSHFEK